MSWRPQTAVTCHSKQTDMRLFRLLLRLADVADDDGIVDPAPSQDTMAGWFDVSRRTIRNWLTALKESGELAQTRVGSGPGNASAYRINLEMPENRKVEKAETDHDETAELRQKVEILTQKVERLEEIVSTFNRKLDEAKVETNTGIVSTFPHKGGKGGKGKVEKVEKKGGNATSGEVHTIHLDPDLDPVNDDDDRACARDPDQVAQEATAALLDFWQDLTGSFAPSDGETRARDYLGPLNRLWIRCGRDADRARQHLAAKRRQMLDEGKTPYRPAAIVPAIFADLDGVNTNGGSGHRRNAGMVEIEPGVY